MSEAIRIVLNDAIVRLDGIAPTMTLLDWLRGPAGLRGTKEGCAEGDCGACTVLWERADSKGGVIRAPINACLAMVGQLAGQGVRTVEGLHGPDGGLHPVQRILAESDGTQCGFCTPGFVMSIAAFAAGGEAAEADAVHDALAGNLCRCTGYRPIVEAALASAALPPDSRAIGAMDIPELLRTETAGVVDEPSFVAPQTLPELLAIRAAHPAAQILAGGTDLGLLASRDRRPPAQLIHVGRVPEMVRIAETPEAIEIGAAVPYERMLPLASRHWPSFAALLRRLGSRQIRNLGTLGGNLGTASPIGDALPVLLALDARLVLQSARGARVVPVDGFFTGYRKTILAPDEVIVAVRLPRPVEGEILECAKVSKRRDQDISAVCGAFRLRLADGVVAEVRLAFGGMAATPARASGAELALRGKPFNADAIAVAAAALATDFKPLDDVRGTSAYRVAVAQGLLRRLELRHGGSDLLVEIDAL